MLAACFKMSKQLVMRLRAIQQAKDKFWDRGVKEVFLLLLKRSKWTKCKRNLKVGNHTEAGQTHKSVRA